MRVQSILLFLLLHARVGGAELPNIGSLDLSTVRANRGAHAGGVAGDHMLETDDIPMSPRAATDAVLETPRTAMGRSDAVTGMFGSVRAENSRARSNGRISYLLTPNPTAIHLSLHLVADAGLRDPR